MMDEFNMKISRRAFFHNLKHLRALEIKAKHIVDAGFLVSVFILFTSLTDSLQDQDREEASTKEQSVGSKP